MLFGSCFNQLLSVSVPSKTIQLGELKNQAVRRQERTLLIAVVDASFDIACSASGQKAGLDYLSDLFQLSFYCLMCLYSNCIHVFSNVFCLFFLSIDLTFLPKRPWISSQQGLGLLELV